MAFVEDRWLKDGQRTELYGKGNRYRARYIDPQGAERSKSFPDKQKKKAEAFLADVEVKKAQGTFIGSDAGKITFQEYADQWLSDCTASELTREKYERRLRLHVYPYFGGKSLLAITSAIIRTWLADLQRTGMAVVSIQNTKAVVASIFNTALDDSRVTRNPCSARSARAPKHNVEQVMAWNGEQVNAMRVALPGRYQAMIDAGGGCGLRLGEICGIAVDDIDLEEGMLHIRRQVRLIRGRIVFALPKHGKTRHVPLPKAVAAAFRHHMATYPSVPVTLPWDTREGKKVTVRLVFTTTYRNAINRSMFARDVWVVALKRARIEAGRRSGAHALRHYYASVLLDAGESIKALAEWLGHSDPGFTLRIYTHMLPKSVDRTRAAIDAAFGYVPDAEDGRQTA